MTKIFSSQKSLIFLLISFCIILWMIRVKLTQSLFMGFLLWNLFLAYIPYCISLILMKQAKNLSKFKLILTLFIWLLFLPNAPYIVTDFIHLHPSQGNLIWLDIFILFTFSSTGIILAITSLTTVYKITSQHWNTKFANYFSISVTFLCGFGIYLGRFLRLNSWDVFTNPILVLKQSILSIKDPKNWFITFSFGSFLYLSFLLYKHNTKLLETN